MRIKTARYGYILALLPIVLLSVGNGVEEAKPAPAGVNVTGTWDASFSGTVERTGTSQTDTFVLKLKQQGSRVTGTLRFKGLNTDFPVSGTIAGTTFTYTAKAELGPDCEASLAAETTVDASSRNFKGSQTQTTCEGTAVGEVTAVRKSARSS
jgi:hypothetical protein